MELKKDINIHDMIHLIHITIQVRITEDTKVDTTPEIPMKISTTLNGLYLVC